MIFAFTSKGRSVSTSKLVESVKPEVLVRLYQIAGARVGR